MGTGVTFWLAVVAGTSCLENEFERHVAPFVQQYCLDCHAAPEPEADLDLATELGRGEGQWTASVWQSVRRRLVAEEMPPAGSRAPPATEREHAVRALRLLLGPEAEADADTPAPVTLRRLNRAEYENTIRDLVGVEFRARDSFPADDVGHGFDNIGDVLSLSPILLEKYLTAAEDIARRAIVVGDAPSAVRRATADQLRGGQGSVREGWFLMISGGEVSVEQDIPREGVYVLRARLYGQQAGPETVRAAFLLDGAVVHEVTVPATRDAPQVSEWKLTLPGGRHRIGVDYLNDYYKPEDPDPDQRDRNLAVEFLELEGPLDAATFPATHRRWIPADCQRRRLDLSHIFEDLMRHAYRRPVSRREIERLHDVVEASLEPEASFEEKVRLGLTTVLVSPQFLFRGERAPPAGATARDLDGHELATRLSYFLWSSMPDGELFACAADGRLLQPDVLAAQVTRMLRDPRATALAENFALQWLRIRPLDEAMPDRDQFPDVDRALLESMQAETLLLFDAVLRESLPVWTLLDSDFTFLNEDLARHYGIPGVRGSWMRRVRVPEERRGGVLTHASMLTVTSNPTRTSPVKRGKWVLEALRNAPPPAPPPGLDNLVESEDARLLSMRERIREHRARPECAVCHDQMDPLGLALEHYDAVGRWRMLDGFHPVDATTSLADGRVLDGLPGLLESLQGDPAFLDSLVRHLFTYALGRGLNGADDEAVTRLVAGLQVEPTLPALIQAMVREPAFRQAVSAPAPAASSRPESPR